MRGLAAAGSVASMGFMASIVAITTVTGHRPSASVSVTHRHPCPGPFCGLFGGDAVGGELVQGGPNPQMGLHDLSRRVELLTSLLLGLHRLRRLLDGDSVAVELGEEGVVLMTTNRMPFIRAIARGHSKVGLICDPVDRHRGT